MVLVGEAQGFINSACRRLGIPRFTHHALRAMFGTTCLEAGIDVRTVAEWLGHKDHGALLLRDVFPCEAGARKRDGGQGDVWDAVIADRWWVRRDMTRQDAEV